MGRMKLKTKVKKLALSLTLLFVLIMVISSVCAHDLDNPTDNLICSDDGSIESSDRGSDSKLAYSQSTSGAYINSDQEDITITKGDTPNVSGSLVDIDGNNHDGEDFPITISSNEKTASRELSNHKISCNFDDSLNFIASDNPYSIEFAPDESKYGSGYLEQGSSDLDKSWVKSTVKSRVIEPSLTYEGVVSGDVEVNSTNPWTTSGVLNYTIPNNAKEIKNAIIYINIYSGSGSNPNYALDSNASITTINGNVNLGYEELLTLECSPDATVYTLNGHVTRVYSDYQLLYNVTEIVNGLNGTSVSVNVDSIQKEGYQFDGRIKLIALLLAYDDGDEDIINYWVDANQRYTTESMNLEFDTSSIKYVDESMWKNILLSSAEASYKINSQPVDDALVHVSGQYYQFNKWNVTESLTPATKTTLTYSNNGFSAKSVLAVLTVKTHEDPTAEINSISPEYSGIAYPGTVNALNIKVTPSRTGKYIIRLLADDVVVNTTEFDLIGGQNTLTIIDPTIRAIDETTVLNNNNKNVNWTVEVGYGENTIATKNLTVKILYNGYLGSEYAYGIDGYDSLMNISFTGDVVVDIKGDSTYMSSGNSARTDVWDVNLDNNSNIAGGFIIVPYNWFNYANGANVENSNMINATFNGHSLTAIAFNHDNPNLGWNYGYGSLIYDVSGLINSSGENSLVLNRIIGDPALNPSIFVYYYNTTGSTTLKNMYIVKGYDLFNNRFNKANRTNQAKSIINVESNKITNATIYIFAAGADKTDGHVVVNGEIFENCWNGGSKTTDLFQTDVTSIVKDSNNVSFVCTGETISSLAQFIVTSKDFAQVTASMKVLQNTKNIIYPEFNNTLSITVNTNKAGRYTFNLLANGLIVNTTEIDLNNGNNTLSLVDPTIRPLNESAKYIGSSGSYNNVDYQLQVLFNEEKVGETSCQAIVLYNGYLGKDIYNETGLESFYNATITGNIVFLTNGTYASGINKYDLTNFTVNLTEKDLIVKAFLYVTYTYGGANDNIDMFIVTLNDNKLNPVFFARDQSNLKSNTGSGVVVYDVSNYIINGTNVLDLNKTGSAGVYPATLVYMYNTTGSKLIKEVYISNGADLLGTYGGLNNPIQVSSLINVDSSGMIDATAYIFANGAVDGRGTVVINGESESHPWNGSSLSTDLYVKDMTSTINDKNNISVIFSGTSGSFTVLQQIIVLTKKVPEKLPTKIIAPSVKTVYNSNKKLIVTLKDSNGNLIANAKITIVLNGQSSEIITKENGQASLSIPSKLSPKDYTVSISYDGDETHIKSTAITKVIVKKATPKLIAKKKTFKAKEKIKKYKIVLKDNGYKAMKKVKVKLRIKGKIYNAKTNSKGKAVFKIKKLTKKGKYTAKVIFNGSKCFNAVSKKVKIYIKK